jgi:hypothetical protein
LADLAKADQGDALQLHAMSSSRENVKETLHLLGDPFMVLSILK